MLKVEQQIVTVHINIKISLYSKHIFVQNPHLHVL